jgi:hypothetical protein
MSYHHLFALNNKALSKLYDKIPDEPLGDSPETAKRATELGLSALNTKRNAIALFTGNTIASFKGSMPFWNPTDFFLSEAPLLKHLGFLEYDINTVAIRAEGFEFRVLKKSELSHLDRAGLSSAFSHANDRIPRAQELIDAKIRDVMDDPLKVINAKIHNSDPHMLPDLSDVVATVFTASERVVEELRSADSQLRLAFGKAVLDAAQNRYATTVNVSGISSYPAFWRRFAIRENIPTTMFWVFNGLHAISGFDERHWRRLEKTGYLKS